MLTSQALTSIEVLCSEDLCKSLLRETDPLTDSPGDGDAATFKSEVGGHRSQCVVTAYDFPIFSSSLCQRKLEPFPALPPLILRQLLAKALNVSVC